MPKIKDVEAQLVKSISINNSESGSVSVVPAVRKNGNPPALDEAQLVVRQLHFKWQFRYPDSKLKRSAEVLVAENHPGVHGTPRLLPVHKHVVAIHGHLLKKTET